MAGGVEGVVYVWDGRAGEGGGCVAAVGAGVRAAAGGSSVRCVYSLGRWGNIIGVGEHNGTVSLLDCRTWRVCASVDTTTFAGITNWEPRQVMGLSFRGSRMATASKSGVVCVWESVPACELSSGCHMPCAVCPAHMRRPRRASSFGARAVELGPDRIVTGGNDGRLLVWPFASSHANRAIVHNELPSRIVNDYSEGGQVLDLCSCDDAFLISASANGRAQLVDFRHWTSD